MTCSNCSGTLKLVGLFDQKTKPEEYKKDKYLEKSDNGYLYEKWKCKKCGRIERFFLYAFFKSNGVAVNEGVFFKDSQTGIWISEI